MKLQRKQLKSDPFQQFERWFRAAHDAGLDEPNAMSLATVSEQGTPSSRMVLLKYWDERGFVFFTNYGSRKSQDISKNSHVALLFYWETLHRQIRIEGTAEKVPMLDSAKYFALRPRGSQLGAWCSTQSSTLSSRSMLEAKLAEIKQKFQNLEIPVPSFWGGYRVTPARFEFWQQGEDRLHDRFVYEPGAEESWAIRRLAP